MGGACSAVDEESTKGVVILDAVEDKHAPVIDTEGQVMQHSDFATEFGILCGYLDKSGGPKINLEVFSANCPRASKAFFETLDLANNKSLDRSEFKKMFLLEDGTYDKDKVVALRHDVEEKMKLDKPELNEKKLYMRKKAGEAMTPAMAKLDRSYEDAQLKRTPTDQGNGVVIKRSDRGASSPPKTAIVE